MVVRLSDAELSTAVGLLKKNSSINAVSAYLKRRGLASSASSWDVLAESRLKPALASGALSRHDIVQLLRESEEFGRQHVFLFRCPRSEAMALTNEAVLRKSLAALDVESLLAKPRIVGMTNGLQLVDVRLENSPRGTSLVVKGVDVRRRKILVNAQTVGNREILTYEWEEDRAVSVLRVAADGLAEVRVQSYRNAVDYVKEAENLFGKCVGIVDRFKFESLSLAKARLHMIEKRKSLAGVVRFAENTLRSKKGGEIRASTQLFSKNMFDDDDELDGSVETFLSKGQGKSNCDAINCTWLKRPGNAGPISDIHTLIGGANNEFVVIPQCERSDYEYVLEKITSLGK